MTGRGYKFKVGQKVRMIPQAWDPAVPTDDFRVVRLLPRESADHQYRIQSLTDGHERVVRESQLA